MPINYYMKIMANAVVQEHIQLIKSSQILALVFNNL